jgi:hypothetical protein
MHLVEGEMVLRAKAGQLHRSLREEAGYLSNWLAENHPNAPRAKPKAIENSLRDKYRKLRGPDI